MACFESETGNIDCDFVLEEDYENRNSFKK